MTEEEIEHIVALAPPSLSLQARAALTGTVTELVELVRGVGSLSPAGWRAYGNMWYMLGLAGRHRPPAEVASLIAACTDEISLDVVVEHATARQPAELAAIVTRLCATDDDGDHRYLADTFLRQVVSRRPAHDLAALLVALPDRDGARPRACLEIVRCVPAPAIARTLVHLRTANAEQAASRLLSALAEHAPSDALADVLASTSRFGDDDSVGSLIGAAAAWQLAAADGALPDVNRIATLTGDLLESECNALARQVVDRTLAGYRTWGERYRFLALVFVFERRELGAEAAHVLSEVFADAQPRDMIDMLVSFCETEQPEPSAYLVRSILTQPAPDDDMTISALQLTRRRPDMKDEIFAAVARWPAKRLFAFEQRLADLSDSWSQDFRSTVCSVAHQRSDGAAIADIIDWLHDDPADKRGDRSKAVITAVIGRGDAELTLQMIRRLRGRQRWRVHRENVTRQVSADFDVGTMTAVIGAGTDSMRAVMWLAMHWLVHKQRSAEQTVQVLASLQDARPNADDLGQLVSWVAHQFWYLPDRANNPGPLLERDDRRHELARAWYRPQRKKPDVDPLR